MFLIAALIQIYNIMKDQAKLIINVRKMAMHALAFGLYLIAALMMTYVNSWRTHTTNISFLIISFIWISLFMAA
jgi:hypothetical protein